MKAWPKQFRPSFHAIALIEEGEPVHLGHPSPGFTRTAERQNKPKTADQ